MTDRVEDQYLTSILEALYRVASDPDRWEELVDALPLDGAVAADHIAPDLRRSVEIAERMAAAAEPARTRRPGEARLNRRLRIQDADLPFRAMAGLALDGGDTSIRFANADCEAALERAASRARTTAQPAFVVLRFADAPDRVVGRIAAVDAGFRLRISAPPRSVSGLGAALGLSPAEARLVEQLRGAGNLREAADDLDISVNTARNQLASVFDKLGIRRQSDLIGVLNEAESYVETLPSPPRNHPAVQSLRLPDGRRLAFRAYGDASGRPVLAFHEGLGSSLLPPSTAALAQAAGLRIVVADRPGFGRSDMLEPYDFAAVAADMEALCDHVAFADVTLMGLLSGVAPMLETAARLGGRARAAVLLSGRAPGDAGGTSDLLAQFRARLTRNTWATRTVLRLLRYRNTPDTVARMLQRAARHSPGDAEFLQHNPDVPDYLSACVAEALAQDAAGPAAELTASLRMDRGALARLSAPLHLFHGQEDRLAPLGALQRYLGERPYELQCFTGIGQLMALKHWRDILGRI